MGGDLLGRFTVLISGGLSQFWSKHVETGWGITRHRDPALKDGAMCRFEVGNPFNTDSRPLLAGFFVDTVGRTQNLAIIRCSWIIKDDG